ncbi:MAG: NAD-dependent epimerase/dehydratase family protein [bacterium]|nr:NAD-dependent epimerase/dehydratase family protein [bacterium]
MSNNKPSIIVSGASGFIGRHFLDTAKNRYKIFALARRPQREAGVEDHPNIKWIQVDLADWPALKRTITRIDQLGGADYVLHLAAYYDYSYKDHPEYIRTNVNATRHLLEQARWLKVERFIFASSLAACRFPPAGEVITEESPADADYPYARTKRSGENLAQKFSTLLPCSVVRFAAVYSDWCEYPPLYSFLSTWLSHRWNTRLLGGRGRSAIPYIHVKDIVRFLLRLLEKSKELAPFGVYHASPDALICHRELFDRAVRCHFGHRVDPLYIPKWAAYPGVAIRDLIGRLAGRRPFERTWMLRYVDLQLEVDPSRSWHELNWRPTPRYDLRRRLLFLIEKMKSDPAEWHHKNEAAWKHTVERANLKIYDALTMMQDSIVKRVLEKSTWQPPLGSPDALSWNQSLQWYVGFLYRVLRSSVRNGDRTLLHRYVLEVTRRCPDERWDISEILGILSFMGETVTSKLLARPELQGLAQEAHDCVTLTIQMALDGIEDSLEDQEYLTKLNMPRESVTHDVACEDRALAALQPEMDPLAKPWPEDIVEATSEEVL